MKGLIIKDFFCFRKQLINFAFVITGVIVITVMFAISYRWGNIAQFNNELMANEMMTQTETVQVASIAALLFMLTPIACSGDVSALFTTDTTAGFQKVAAVLPVSLAKRVACRYITTLLLIGVGVGVDLGLSFWITSMMEIISFKQFSGVIISFASMMVIYVSILILLTVIMGVKRIQYASFLPVIAGPLVFLFLYRDNIKEFLLYHDVYQFNEIYQSAISFIENKSYLLFLIGCITMLVSYVLTVEIARRKRGVF